MQVFFLFSFYYLSLSRSWSWSCFWYQYMTRSLNRYESRSQTKAAPSPGTVVFLVPALVPVPVPVKISGPVAQWQIWAKTSYFYYNFQCFKNTALKCFVPWNRGCHRFTAAYFGPFWTLTPLVSENQYLNTLPSNLFLGWCHTWMTMQVKLLDCRKYIYFIFNQ